jgi:hypothetical protein
MTRRGGRHRSKPSAGSGHSSKDAVTTSAAGTFRRATAARFSLSSTAVTCHPRATIGAVACPMPHPISSTRGPGAVVELGVLPEGRSQAIA